MQAHRSEPPVSLRKFSKYPDFRKPLLPILIQIPIKMSLFVIRVQVELMFIVLSSFWVTSTDRRQGMRMQPVGLRLLLFSARSKRILVKKTRYGKCTHDFLEKYYFSFLQVPERDFPPRVWHLPATATDGNRFSRAYKY